uniref:Uncharacterized protein n=1 Tax=viral metagenome TaxID=1070528 RepID=A0A6M3KIC6_9ZZZZ
MYIDANLAIVTSQDLGDSQAPATVLGENSVDLGAAKDLSKGKQLYVIITVEESFVGNTSVTFQVITDSVATLADTPTVHASTAAIAVASLTAGRAPIVIPIANPLGVEEQYLGIQFVIAGGTGTAGIVSACIGFDAP